MTERKIAIVIPVLSNFKGLAHLFHSINLPLLPIIIPNWVVNIGVAAAWNQGLGKAREAGCTHVLISNDDVMYGDNTIKDLADFLDDPANIDCVMATGCNNRGAVDGGTPLRLCGDRTTAEHPDFSCFMVRPDFPEIVGWFDENFSPAFFEDNDAHARIKLAGKLALNVGWAVMYHVGSATANGPGPRPVSHESFRRNREYFIRKWGAEPNGEATTPFKTPFNNPSMTVRDWSRSS